MGKADDLKAEYAAAIAMAELEDELVKLKAEPGDGKKLRQVKHKLRDARREQRTAREATADEGEVA
jgi:hypothetical protein